jgi:Ni/Fe-hydrogenase subunit HybB-like protein
MLTNLEWNHSSIQTYTAFKVWMWYILVLNMWQDGEKLHKQKSALRTKGEGLHFLFLALIHTCPFYVESSYLTFKYK